MPRIYSIDDHCQTFNLQPSTFNLQPSTFNLQPSTFNLQPSTFNLQPSTSNLKSFLCIQKVIASQLINSTINTRKSS
ncbi:hypothetical protein E0L21_06310 [Kosakonia quasisacchari]|uniref:Uncharacterized protein n=1 Tax=Kosakonia quasisacchari TaxID=2529380 RepID=A0A4R0HRC6_9ENTR|nr:hypothetical protein E0L21_06310 [Kosakonia quasisacchari]